MSHNEILAVMFEISESALMKANDDGNCSFFVGKSACFEKAALDFTGL